MTGGGHGSRSLFWIIHTTNAVPLVSFSSSARFRSSLRLLTCRPQAVYELQASEQKRAALKKEKEKRPNVIGNREMKNVR